MQVQELIKLAGSGNVKDVEQEWLTFLSESDASAKALAPAVEVIDLLKGQDRADLAESLAWTAIESVQERTSAEEALRAAQPMMLKLNKSTELRGQVTKLYKQIYEGRDGLDRLMEEAGLEGGRPPRRAMRTMDVCLAIEPGMYMVGRHEDVAGRVESVDTDTWTIEATVGGKVETFEAVEFADQFAPANEDDYRVLAAFDHDRLSKMLTSNPADVIESVLIVHGEPMPDDELQQTLVPKYLPAGDWSKWWTKARTAARRSANIKIEGRSPYILEYAPGGPGLHEEFEEGFKKLKTAEDRMVGFEGYLRECKARKLDLDKATLQRLHQRCEERTTRLTKNKAATALPESIVAWQIGEAIGEADGKQACQDILANSGDPLGMIRACGSSKKLWSLGLDCLALASPDNYVEYIVSLMPTAPTHACEDLADRLDKAGLAAERYDALVLEITSNALACHGALCWLWDRGITRSQWQTMEPVSVLTRILQLAGEISRDDRLEKNRVKAIRDALKSSLTARKYDRYDACLSQIESGMGSALLTQVRRLESLGRNVREDLQNRITRQFPDLIKKKEIPIWLREDTIYATRKGVEKLDAEISDLVNVKMRENAKAIGAAAEKGDLSENSEYKFALEERDLLRARLAQMQKQRALVQILSPDNVPSDHVSVGSVVGLSHLEQGVEKTLTFLGPFEAKIEENIYNYLAPFSQELMGHKVGDIIELTMGEPEGQYEIVSTKPWTTA